MSKKIIITLITFVISFLFIFLLVDYNKNIKKEYEKNFSVKNISSINKVFISDRKGNNIVLEKNSNSWIVNNQFEVRKDAIETLLNTVRSMEIQRPVSNTSYNNVIRQLASTGVKVEIYHNNKITSFTVGGSTKDHLGTYMLKEDADSPYIVHIPGFNGFLSPRFGIQGYEIDPTSWRNNNIFKIPSEDINEISLLNYEDIYNSFVIKCNPLALIDNKNNSLKYDLNKITDYFNNFSNIECEKFKGFNIDLSNEKQLYQLIIKHNDMIDVLDVFSFSKKNNNSNQSEPNVERMYAVLNNGEYMLIQKYVFNKVFISIEDLEG
jgi:hypothetical protein